MNTIEQRVLIPVSPGVIWNIICDIASNPKWQVDCRHIAFISGMQQSRGARWRFTPLTGREYIIEITAWYNQVGYEYRLIGSGTFKEAIGRIKLHETPDGTVVHWEFQYEVSGLIGGLRNSLVTRRNIENTIADSLWALWELANKLRHEQPKDYVFRSLMQAAPNAEERANYKPRVEHNEDDIVPTKPSIITPEPPAEEEDTRPGVAVTAEPSIPSPAALDREKATESTAEKPDSDAMPEANKPLAELVKTEEMPHSNPPLSTTPNRLEAEASDVSVFELFGLKRPSEVQPDQPEEHSAARNEIPDLLKPPKDPIPTVLLGRHGLRSSLRKQRLHIRHPK